LGKDLGQMKIIWIYKYSAMYNFDKWFHLEYVRWMKNNGYDIIAYGPELHQEYSDIICFPYNPHFSWDDILQKTKADVAILNTKSRMFGYYSPTTKQARDCILPRGFVESNAIPKVVIEEDAHYETDGKWYKEVGINLLLQRHYSQSIRNWGVKTLWHPFSVDESIFKPNRDRINKVCFAGSITTPYPERRKICNILSSERLIDVFESSQKIERGYIECLQNYSIHLSTPSIYDITAAKNFEIMSSGSVLMTPKFSGIDILFPNNSYCEIALDGSNVISKAQELLLNQEYRAEVSKNGRECILQRHTNRIRTEELLHILRTEL